MGGALLALLADEVSGPGLAPPGYGWALAKMLGALLLVCLLAYGLLRAARRWSLGRAPAGRVKVLERCPLSSRHSLWVVEVDGRSLLLASSDAPGGPVTKLAELDTAPPTATTEAPGSQAPRSFRELLGLGGKPRSEG